jgi:hypothetical protein
MVSLIPRVSSFAVSGTPARASVDDLIHLVKYGIYFLFNLASTQKYVGSFVLTTLSDQHDYGADFSSQVSLHTSLHSLTGSRYGKS